MNGQRLFTHRACWIYMAGLLFVLAASGNAHAQGFMVKPMKMEFAPRPGQTAEAVLDLRNTGADEARTLDLKLVELGQNSQGSWLIIEPGAEVDTSKLPSCLKWVKLSAESVDVAAMQVAPVTVTLKVPPNARGFYLAGLIAQSRPKPAEKGISIVIRFLIPILVEIEGRPQRQKIELSDAGMTFRKAEGDKPADTVVSMGVVNEGRTYSRIKGSVKVMFLLNDKWRPVSTADFRDLGIIPGAKLDLPADLGRRLPSGRYKLTAAMYVDGRRVKPLEKEIDFTGDPAVTKVAADTALVLDPLELSITAAPGSTRTSIIKVENASEDEVEITAVSSTPASLRGVAMGELKGDDLSCAGWLTVTPAKFTLRPGGKQNIRVIVMMPKTDKMQANYYGLLTLRATYPDGQSAGETTSLVCLGNPGAEVKPAVEGVKMTLAATDGAQYAIQARFANIGNVHFRPVCRAVLVDNRGQMVAKTELSGEEGLMLPLGTRDFSGILDFEKVEPGKYALTSDVEFAPGKIATQQLAIQVSEEEGRKVVTVITPGAAEPAKP